MSDRLFFLTIGFLALLMIGVSLVYPQGMGRPLSLQQEQTTVKIMKPKAPGSVSSHVGQVQKPSLPDIHHAL